MDGPTFSNGMAVLYLLGAAQGLFLAAVLASRHRNALPNRLLAALMLVFSFDLAMAVYHASAFSTQAPTLIGLDVPIAFLYGPLLYLYVRTVTAEPPVLRRADLAHFAPFLLLVLFLLPFFLRPGAEKLALMQDPSGSVQTQALAVINPLKLVHGFVYIVLVVWVQRRHQQHVKDAFSSVEHVTLRWLRNLTMGVVAMLAASAFLYALSERASVVGMDPSGIYDDLTLLGVTVLVYALGYFGLRQPEIFAPPAPAAVSGPTRTTSYARSGMRPEDAERHRDALLERMETEHLYRRGDLTLQDLADTLGISSHNLTEVINTQLGQTFYEVVNGYRVREVQARLTDPAYAHWTVLAIGMEAGFNAKSSFNAAFKRHTGMTPSQYRERHHEAV
ncbi:MAG: helix-turn-helix transcriptional regulator [Rhodothermaceae bacterium]|nr:helix-turn-helix transcriptional regulator [Rhodothermaceae bacterium]